MTKRENIIGNRYGRLVVSAFSHANDKGRLFWNCICDCGETNCVSGNHLRSGHTSSCGCYGAEVHIKHGLYKSRQYRSWQAMKSRVLCSGDAQYKNYGGRGITICDNWLTFDGFWKDMEKGYVAGRSIDRINVEGNYCKGNCRWATNAEQARNKRSNKWQTHNGETMVLGDWADKYGIPRSTFYAFIGKGKTIKDAIVYYKKREASLS